MQFAEIRHDYIWGEAVENGLNHRAGDPLLAAVSIDAWETGDDDEEGRVGDGRPPFPDEVPRAHLDLLRSLDTARERTSPIVVLLRALPLKRQEDGLELEQPARLYDVAEVEHVSR